MKTRLKETRILIKAFMTWTFDKIRIWVGWIWGIIIDQAEAQAYHFFGDQTKEVSLINPVMDESDLNLN